MRVFCYFVEPASYTIDLIVNVHSKQGIGYAFINNKSDYMVVFRIMEIL